MQSAEIAQGQPTAPGEDKDAPYDKLQVLGMARLLESLSKLFTCQVSLVARNNVDK